MKRLRKKRTEKEYGKLKGAVWASRKNEADLTPEENGVLRILSGHSRISGIAYGLCNELTDIFNQDITEKDAQRKIRVRMEVVGLFGLDCPYGFLSTLKKRMEEITDYSIKRQTGGFAEGLNRPLAKVGFAPLILLDKKRLWKEVYYYTAIRVFEIG